MIPFGERLKKARKEAGYRSQEALAEALDCAKMTILRWEKGETEPSFADIERLDAKGGGRQWVELSPRVAEALREQLASHKSKWIWPGSDPAEPLRGDTAYDRLRAAAKHLKLAPGLLWHSLRHAYISRLCMLGVPLPTVQKLARHKSIAMTLRYAHFCPDHTRQALEQLDRFTDS